MLWKIICVVFNCELSFAEEIMFTVIAIGIFGTVIAEILLSC